MFFNYEGQRVPQVTLGVFTKQGWHALTTTHLFARKTVVMFAVPGAFTSPHSSTHLSGYNVHAEDFRAYGVDEIICISVNDSFSLAAWARKEKADRVRFVPDVNGEFTKELGMMVNLSDRGMGQRSWRYSMLIRDQVIEKMFVEPDGFETPPVVSDAETMLNYLRSETKKPEQTAVLMHMWRTILSA
ncbi:Redoxin superfamily [Synechococcus sp. PCC 7335]|uniref:peroxiredoxin n=1 Tax=Synechococcus sp. (strain ATCC 29403 / PCC 7335) TaxID=91464 RepID=UPI00017EC0A5|nr:peroxiredoxin [Synechococcus sp. PCC 7335]EDX83512.1 Redoxin superfamily [Synechococcus sp. PCC 7335]